MSKNFLNFKHEVFGKNVKTDFYVHRGPFKNFNLKLFQQQNIFPKLSETFSDLKQSFFDNVVKNAFYESKKVFWGKRLSEQFHILVYFRTMSKRFSDSDGKRFSGVAKVAFCVAGRPFWGMKF